MVYADGKLSGKISVSLHVKYFSLASGTESVSIHLKSHHLYFHCVSVSVSHVIDTDVIVTQCQRHCQCMSQFTDCINVHSGLDARPSVSISSVSFDSFCVYMYYNVL